MQTEEQKIQELLKPRYLLTADYPGCSFEVGTILEPNEDGELYSKKAGYSWTVSRVLEKDVKKFKHLFRKLEWWEELDASEMPKFVKLKIDIPYYGFKKGQICPTGEINSNKESNKYNLTLLGKPLIDVRAVEPATLAEYNSYISSTDKKEKV